MLTRLNTSSEISILPTGLGNHYASTSRLVPPGKRTSNLGARHNSIFSRSSLVPNIDDPDAPEANMSFRAENDYFGPDVLVIVGVVLASIGAILTLVSFYCEFKHPAIQATIAGIGPSLIGIGMLFCVLRLFFCSFFTTRTCCECFADGLRYLTTRIPCLKRFHKRIPIKKKVHPLQVKSLNQSQSSTKGNGLVKQQDNSQPKLSDKNGALQRDKNGNKVRHKSVVQYQAKFSYDVQPPRAQSLEMVPMSFNGMRQLDKNSSTRQAGNDASLTIVQEKSSNEHLTNQIIDDLEFDVEAHKQDEDDFLKDEIANLDNRLTSANSDRAANESINDLVLKRSKM